MTVILFTDIFIALYPLWIIKADQKKWSISDTRSRKCIAQV